MASSAAATSTNEQARVTDASGGWITNSTLTSVNAVAQPLPVGDTASAGFRNYSGFLRMFLLLLTDTDGDGRADEDDADDDGDGLDDVQEIGGEQFDPVTPTDSLRADSDGDGADDADEAAAGTNPQDAGNRLRITGVTREAGAVTVRWTARDARTYDLQAAEDVSVLETAPWTVTNLTASGGTGVWQVTEAQWTGEPVGTSRFYRVRIHLE
jgi:hypothetical protein